MISQELQIQLLEGIQALSKANNELRTCAEELARADHAYRQAKAKSYLNAVTSGEKMTVDHIKAIVDRQCEAEMLACRLAEAMREVALERVRSLRTEISAMQSIAGAYREEAAAVRYGQAIG